MSNITRMPPPDGRIRELREKVSRAEEAEKVLGLDAPSGYAALNNAVLEAIRALIASLNRELSLLGAL